MAEKLLEKIVEAPSVAVETVFKTSEKITQSFNSQKQVKKARHFWKLLGPGLTTGAADDDPSGIATYSQTGAKYGFQLLWLALFTFPLMAVVQEMCARIGLVTGRGLAANIRLYFPRWVLYLCAFLLLTANSLNIGADLGAMAKATQLIWPELNFAVIIVGFTFLSLILQILIPYEKYSQFLKFLALILLAYVVSAFTILLDWGEVVKKAILPTIEISGDQLFLIVAVLGTTISPYLFFWQTSQEVEVEILEGKTTLDERQQTTAKQIKEMRIDVWSGMFFSNAVMFFIIAVCAATLYVNGITDIESAQQAASALRPLAGDGAYLLFALGIIGTGLLAVPVLAGSAAYAIAESFHWKEGLYRRLKDAQAFYGVIIISMAVGLILNFVGLDPIDALIYSAVVNGLVAPVVLVLILLLSQNQKIMGERKNNFLTTAAGWFITCVMIIAGVATVFSLIF